MGIAPECDIVGVKVLDKKGQGNSINVLMGMQWVMDNRQRYNIRVVNLSVGTLDMGRNDPLVKAVEAMWDEGVVVVAAAGNNGPSKSTVTSPGVSRKIITVGAADDHRHVEIWGDDLVNFSGRGPTSECIIKPDCIAPGANIVSLLSSPDARRGEQDKIVDKYYLELSGTSMATPIVSGAIALLLQKRPTLTPDEVKLKLKKSCRCLGHHPNHQGWGLLNIEKLIY